MSTTEPFTGLNMSVFTAFGWAGEETALNYALSQLELFIGLLHADLGREARHYLPFWGLDEEAKTVYLASHQKAEEGVYITFNARPMTFAVRLTVSDKAVLARGLKAAEQDIDNWYRLLTKLVESWTLHIQQKHVDEETGEVSHYQELCKSPLADLNADSCTTVTQRAAFLNGEPKWITPIHLIHEARSEHIANLGQQGVPAMSKQVDQLLAIIDLFVKQGRKRPPSGRKAKPRNVSTNARAVASDGPETAEFEQCEQFTYVAQLKSLHIRKGFVNLTPQHWPFFALNARSGSRAVTLRFDNRTDKESTVWRLNQPHDLARLVLGASSHTWLENNFQPDDPIQVTAQKMGDGEEIQVILSPVEPVEG